MFVSTFPPQVSEQMKTQTSPSSTIIIALTDGKLQVFPYELTVQEVLNAEDNSISNGYVFMGFLKCISIKTQVV